MVKFKNHIFIILIFSFLVFSFYPTIFEISSAEKLKIKNRDFILEHNYYWPDFNLYLSKIRQGYENRWLAVEKYTSEPHKGSFIQIFYLYLGRFGKVLNIGPNYAYQLGRIILSPLLLTVLLLLVTHYFTSWKWSIFAFLITVVSGSFPHLTFVEDRLRLSRYMEWWSNIDSLQRLTFIPHIIFGQIISFFLLYKLTVNRQHTTKNKLLFYIILGNLTGLVFPPSLITLISVLLLLSFFFYFKKKRVSDSVIYYLLFVIFSLPSLFYLFIITKTLPWSSLVEFHRTHPMMIPLDQYILGTGPVIFLGLFGGILAIIKRKKHYFPLILWVVVTFLFASLFSLIREQSPLRFTQTGLFIPLGILGAFLFEQVWLFVRFKKYYFICYLLFVIFYLIINLVIMHNSLTWQLTFIRQRINADIPQVPYPPQTMYPLTEWMDGIRWLRNNSRKDDVVLAEITAGNFIPAYAGNFVYFGQSNTVDYSRKQYEVDNFFRARLSPGQVEILLKSGRIKFIFVGPQEREKLAGKKLEEIYPDIKYAFSNALVTIYSTAD